MRYLPLIKRRNAQSSVELALILGFVFMVFMGAYAVASNLLLSTQISKDMASLEAVGDMLATEIKIAHSVQDGYYREFYAPVAVNGLDYEVFLEPSKVGSLNANQNTSTLVIKYKNAASNAQIVLSTPVTNITSTADGTRTGSPGWSVDPLARKDSAGVPVYVLALAKQGSGYKNIIKKVNETVWISVK